METSWTDARIAVVGAGIAGLAVAAALHRAGIRCEVYEQAVELTEVGAGLQLSPNATLLLGRLGVDTGRLRPVRPEAVEIRRWEDGRLLSRTPLGDACEARYGAPYLCVHRADLHAALRRLVPAEQFRLDSRVTGLAEDADGVNLRLAWGGVRRADMVIGADGIRSVVRALLAADRPRFSGQYAYRALLPADRFPGPDRPVVRIWMGPSRHLVCYPVSGGRQYSMAAVHPGAGEPDGESWQRAGDPAELLAGYQGWHEQVLAILSAAGSVTRWALHDRDPVRRWHSHRVVLVGDAAHPMLPFGAQGAAQALEDAAALAGCLVGAGGDLATALPRYAAVRRPRAGAVVEYVRGNARNHHVADGEEQRRRDAGIRRRWGPDGLDWLYGYDAEAAVDELAASA